MDLYFFIKESTFILKYTIMVKKIKRISKICRKIEIVYGFLYLGQIKEQEIKRPMKPEYNAFG